MKVLLIIVSASHLFETTILESFFSGTPILVNPHTYNILAEYSEAYSQVF